MSLTSGMYTGVSGLLAQSQAMNVIGNNISNVNTIGFKDSRTVFADMLSQSTGANAQVGTGANVQAVQNIFSQGSSQSTDNVTDLSIQGNSFFALTSPSATSATTPTNAFLTRAGAFHVDSNYYLVNPDGYRVLDNTGTPIKFTNTGSAPTSDFSKIVKVDTKGNITYLATDGITQVNYTNPIGVVSVPDTMGLRKVGGSLFQPTANAGVGTSFSAATNTANGTSESVLSNTLEQSNVDMATEFVNMITTQRAYSANSKTITTVDQMTQEVLGLIR